MLGLALIALTCAPANAQPVAARQRIAFPDARLEVDGLPWFGEDKPALRRLPLRLKDRFRPPVWELAQAPSGGRIRFRTDSTTIGLVAENPHFSNMHHMASVGENGFDVYVGREYVGSAWPDASGKMTREWTVGRERKMRDITLYLPLYKAVTIQELSLDADAHLESATPYAIAKPIVYYGSSITQGGCASNPGGSCQALLERKLNADFVNLGFSGNGLGEPALAEAICELDPSCIVLDFWGNPSADQYATALPPFVDILRRKWPRLPILVTSPFYFPAEEYGGDVAREQSAKRLTARTFVETRRTAGDRWIWCVDGLKMLNREQAAGLVDGVHCNSLGFYFNSLGLEPFLHEALSLQPATERNTTVELRAEGGQLLNESNVFSRSLVSPGDPARLQRALAKARRGESVTVGVIGGSITQGASASQPDKRYGERVAAWWRRTFPKTNIRFINAGIGATGSDYGALRIKRDLLAYQPDLVVVEYAVNDPNTQAAAETLEGLTRQTLQQTNQPAVLLLFTMHQGGGNAQEWHAKVGRHYDLPMVSFRDALWPEIKEERLKWSDVEADAVHPNDRGHDYCARFITRLLDQVLTNLPADDRLPQVKPLPKPVFTDLFEHVALFEADALKPLSHQGWSCETTQPGDKYWKADQPGSVLEFEITGQVILIMDWHIRGPMGQASARVDDRPPVLREGWFEQTWGGYRQTTLLARGLDPGKHRVRIELLPDKNPQSTGHEFRVLGLGAAGVRVGN